MIGRALAAIALTVSLAAYGHALFPAAAAQQAHNMRLVGFHDLHGRSAYQPVIQRYANGQYVAFIGHHDGRALNPLTGETETSGTSIIDVTDPANPKYLRHLPGAAGAQMVRTCRGRDLPKGGPDKIYLLRTNGNREHQILDVTNPAHPTLLSTPVSGLNGTHKNYWECETGIAYLVSGVSGSTKVPSDPSGYREWRTHRMTQVFDLGDPANPRFIRNFGIAGQQPGATAHRVPQGVHGCISAPARQRVYCGHGTSSDGIVMILDRKELLDPKVEWADRKNPTVAELKAPVIARLDTPKYMGAHSTFPVLDLQVPNLGPVNARRDILVVVNESLANECKESRQSVYLVDITDESNPWPVSTFDVGRYEAPGPDKDFCQRGGRFGAHASSESFAAVFYRKLVAVSWFNAGVRLIDVRDPLHPVEAGYFIPRTTRHTTRRAGKTAIQTNNVEVDDRGFVYITDRANTGLHILAVSGDALGSPAQMSR